MDGIELFRGQLGAVWEIQSVENIGDWRQFVWGGGARLIDETETIASVADERLSVCRGLSHLNFVQDEIVAGIRLSKLQIHESKQFETSDGMGKRTKHEVVTVAVCILEENFMHLFLDH